MLMSERGMQREFADLEQSILLIDHSMSGVMEHASKSSDDETLRFARALHFFFRNRSKFLKNLASAAKKVNQQELIDEKADQELLSLLNEAESGHRFSPSEVAAKLEKSFDLFRHVMRMQVIYHISDQIGRTRFNVARPIKIRTELLEKMRSIFSMTGFERMLTSDNRARLRNVLTKLIEKRYPDLLKFSNELDQKVAYYNFRFQEMYNILCTMHMFKEPETKKGFWAAVFGTQKKSPQLLTLTPAQKKSDIERVRVSLHKRIGELHRSFEDIKTARDSTEREMQQIKEDEAELRGIFKKCFIGRDLRRLR
ncbi:hypothetical protein JW898_05840 [Candidatus Woesearchaeota archaeon]|nr:hypothetical protein [Candidatus Woesearchaeota archaeon]